ncbi:MAG: T9SS type A sorting domain-containing protein [Saprospiraceae bacterium]
MKKSIFILTFCLSGILSYSQTTTYSVTENFESYNNEEFLGVVNPARWKVVFDDPATPTDVKVSNVKAHAGKNSIYLFSNISGGGPQNVYMPLFQNGTTEDHGTMDFSVWLYIPTQQGAYFNFQALNPVTDAIACQVYFDNNNFLRIVDEDNQTTGYTRYAQNSWIKFSVRANLTSNEWSFSYNDKLFAINTFENNTLYAFNINPQSIENQSSFYLDDISYTFKKDELNELDASISPIQMKSDILAGRTSVVSAQFRNLGKQTIQKIELEWSDGLKTNTQILDNLNIKSLTNKAFQLDQNYLAQVGANNVRITIKKVNEQTDAVAGNNTQERAVSVYVPTPGKKVFGEQATGTWCVWCPRGHVSMQKMEDDYNDYFVGVAVHGDQNDPMRMNSYVGGLNIPGFPHSVVNRNEKQDPSEIESVFLRSISRPVSAKIETSVKLGSSARTLVINPKATFNASASKGAYKLVVILAEDSIRGTTAAYNQANAYAGGRAGVMGGFEKMPNPVPANRMYYRNVARALLNGFSGQTKSFSTMSAGVVFDGTPITYEVPATFQMNKLEVITALIGTDGVVDNVVVDKASNFLLAAEEVVEHPFFRSISPNPADLSTNIDLNITAASSVIVSLVDLSGKRINMQDYGIQEGSQQLSFDTADLPDGMYLMQIQIGNKMLTRKLMVAH